MQIDDNRECIFTNDDGMPVDPNYVSRAFRMAAAAAGLRHIPLRGLRHTHASHMGDAGAAIAVISRRLGHATRTSPSGSVLTSSETRKRRPRAP